MQNLKIKPLTKEQLMISMDRLTRFKETENKYIRVFSDLITSNLIEPKIKKTDIASMDYQYICELAENIINFSLENSGLKLTSDYSINKKLYDYENHVFELNEDVKKLLKNKINYKAVAGFINENSSKNLRWLKALSISDDTVSYRKKAGICFPIEKILLAEGITEEILLPEFARLCGYDFDKNGVYLLSAGGKNQVVKYFYKLVQNCKLPIFILLDKDAVSSYEEIKPKLREIDRVHILKSGEFEDILPESLIERTLAYSTKNISTQPVKIGDRTKSCVEYLEDFFKHRGMHEFKKSEFAELVRINIADKKDVSDETALIIDELRSADFNKSYAF